MNKQAANVENLEVLQSLCSTPAYTEQIAKHHGKTVSRVTFTTTAVKAAGGVESLLHRLRFATTAAGGRTLLSMSEVASTVVATYDVAEAACRYHFPDDAVRLQAATSLCRDVLAALSLAKHHSLCHGALIPDNLVRENGRLVITGLGLNCYRYSPAWRGHQRYLAPEVVGGAGPTSASDVYSLGIIVAEILGGRRGADLTAVFGQLASCSRDLMGILRSATAELPDARPSIEEFTAVMTRLAPVNARMTMLGVAAPPKTVAAKTTTADADTLPPIEGSSAAIELDPDMDSAVVELPQQMQTDLGWGQDLDLQDAKRGYAPSKKAVLRAIPNKQKTRSHSAGELGYYETPRKGDKKTGPWWIVGALVIAAGVVAVVLGVRMLSKQDAAADGLAPIARKAASLPSSSAPSSAAAKPGPSVASAAVTQSEDSDCPAGMKRFGTKTCIDVYESPGKRRMPQTGLTWREAEAACEARGARLCRAREWERACRGEDGDSYPYGASFRKGSCNVDGKVGLAGEFEQCVSASGAHDMSGNVGEWVAGGAIRGGSALDGHRGRCSRSIRRKGNGRYSDVGFRCCAAAQ